MTFFAVLSLKYNYQQEYVEALTSSVQKIYNVAFKSIKFWIFDLDNTLYSGQKKVFEQVDKKMSKYIGRP